MREYPSLPPLSDAGDGRADPLSGGHLWLREYVDGAPLRFSMTETGMLAFGDARTTFASVPLPYRPAARAIRESFDRDALRRAVDDPTAVTFFGVATRRQSVPYDFDRLPPALGTEVARDDRRLPVEAAERILDRLGVPPVNTLDKEVHVRDFRPDRYEFPQSAWYDGPVAGVVVRNRSGARALLANPDAPDGRSDDGTDHDPDPDPEAIAAEEAVADRIRAVARATGDHDPTTVAERVVDAIVRERYDRLYARPARFDPDALTAAVRRRASRLLPLDE